MYTLYFYMRIISYSTYTNHTTEQLNSFEPNNIYNVNTNETNKENKKTKTESKIFIERYADKYNNTQFDTTTQFDFDIKRNIKLDKLGLSKDSPTVSPTVSKRKKLKKLPNSSDLFNISNSYKKIV